MHAKQSVAAVSAAWTVVLCASVAAQLLTPSGMPARTREPLYESLPKAWMRVVVKAPSKTTRAAVRGTTIELVAGPERQERLIASAEFGSAAELQALPGGALAFHDVPTGQPIRLRITIRSSDGAPLGTHAESYVLHYPDSKRVESRGAALAVEESGYLGDFVIDHVNTGVTRIRRDQ